MKKFILDKDFINYTIKKVQEKTAFFENEEAQLKSFLNKGFDIVVSMGHDINPFELKEEMSLVDIDTQKVYDTWYAGIKIPQEVYDEDIFVDAMGQVIATLLEYDIPVDNIKFSEELKHKAEFLKAI